MVQTLPSRLSLYDDLQDSINETKENYIRHNKWKDDFGYNDPSVVGTGQNTCDIIHMVLERSRALTTKVLSETTVRRGGNAEQLLPFPIAGGHVALHELIAEYTF